jgi:polysaccharide export outer membrane protein
MYMTKHKHARLRVNMKKSNLDRRTGHGWFSILAIGVLAGLAWAQDAGNKAELAQPPSPSGSAKDESINPAHSISGKASDDSFVIGADDVLAINVWKEPDISRSIPVRSDGKITLPLVGDLQASGRTPHELQTEIASKLQSYISEPEVAVIVQEVRSQRFNILGQIAKPGSYLLSNSATVLDAIALAGGFRDFAKKKSIYVLRQNGDGTQVRLPFNYAAVITGKNLEQNVKLKPRDTVIIP